MKTALLTALGALLASGTALADRTDYSRGVHSIEITSYLSLPPIVVANVSADRTVEGRELRVSSATSIPLNVRGKITCTNLAPSGSNGVRAAQVMFENPILSGDSIQDLGVPDDKKSERVEFPLGGPLSAEVDIDTAYTFSATWPRDALVTLFFSPVHRVEHRLKQYVQNGGRAIDFLRRDDVFEEKIQVNLVGWCGAAELAGLRQLDLVARIFYKGDPSLVDTPAVGLGGSGGIQAPEPPRARSRVAPAKGSDSAAPPARTTSPPPASARKPTPSDDQGD
jgi:hypothetical protein